MTQPLPTVPVDPVPGAVRPVRRGWALKGCGCLGLLLGGLGIVGALVVLLAAVAGYLYVGSHVAVRLERETIEPDPDNAHTVAGGDQIAVTVPPGLLDEPQVLTLSRMYAPPRAPSDTKLGRAYEVTLGDLHRFDEELEVALSLEAVKDPRRHRITALTYDAASGKWESAPFLLDEKAKRVRIFTTHLSGFGTGSGGGDAPERAPMAKVSSGSYPAFSPVGDLDEAESILTGGRAYAAKAGWDYAQEWFGLGANFMTLVEEVGQAQGLSRLNELAGNLGLGFALLQLCIDMAEGEDVKGVLNATKSIGYYQLGTWGTSAMKIAGVGVFIIDYSLNKFATEAISGRYAIYESAYRAYYRDHRRTSVGWFKEFRRIAASHKDPDAASAAMMTEVDRYVNEFWQNEETIASYQADAQRTGWSGGGGLNEKTKRQLSANHEAELAPIIQMVLERLKLQLVREQSSKVQGSLKAMAAALNRVYTVRVRAQSDDPDKKLEGMSVVIPVNQDQDLWKGKTDAKGEWTMKCTALGYLMYGAPKKITLTVPSSSGEPEVIEKPLVLTGVIFDLDDAAGTYEGRLAGSHSGQGIDGAVQLQGPITIVVNKDGAADVTFSIPVQFSVGGGMGGVKITAKGKGKGTVKGGKLDATARVASSYNIRVAAPGGSQAGTSGGDVKLTGTLESQGKTARIRGKMTSARGGPTLDFTATRTPTK